MTYEDRMKKIIGVIRERPDWVPNHRVITFGDTEVGYYDTVDKKDYFYIRFENVVVTCTFGGVNVSWDRWEQYDTFNLNDWLAKLEGIVKQKTITIDGRKYLLTELKGE